MVHGNSYAMVRYGGAGVTTPAKADDCRVGQGKSWSIKAMWNRPMEPKATTFLSNLSYPIFL